MFFDSPFQILGISNIPTPISLTLKNINPVHIWILYLKCCRVKHVTLLRNNVPRGHVKSCGSPRGLPRNNKQTIMVCLLFYVVAGAGFEPATSRLWAWRAANCSTPRCRGAEGENRTLMSVKPTRF